MGKWLKAPVGLDEGVSEAWGWFSTRDDEDANHVGCMVFLRTDTERWHCAINFTGVRGTIIDTRESTKEVEDIVRRTIRLAIAHCVEQIQTRLSLGEAQWWAKRVEVLNNVEMPPWTKV